MPTIISGDTGVNQIAPGAIEKADLPTGSVLQVVRQNHLSAINTTGNSWVSYGTAQITPQFSSSKILIAHIVSYGGEDNSYAQGRCDRNGTVLRSGNSPVYAENRFTDASFGLEMNANANDSYKVWNTHWQWLDSPATTSTLTYTFSAKADGGNRMVTINYSYNNPSDGYNPSPWSSTVLMEIAE